MSTYLSWLSSPRENEPKEGHLLIFKWCWWPNVDGANSLSWNFIGIPRSRWEFSQKNGEQERTTWGNQSFWKLIPISLFLSLLIYLLLYIGMNTESCGGQQSWPLSKSGASHKKVLGILHHLLAMRPADILWSFLSDNQKTYFFQGCFFLNQAPPSKYSCIPIGWGCSELQSRKEFI